MTTEKNNESKLTETGKLTTYRLCACALMTAVLCILAPISIPIGPVPISLGLFAVFLSAYILGSKWAAVSCAIYLALGAVGLPVFSGFSGGIGKLFGPTGGYLIGYIFTVIIAGMFIAFADKHFESKKKHFAFVLFGMIVALLVTYAFGTVWFVIWSGTGIGYALTVCVLPFIPFDLVKIVIAMLLGNLVRSRLKKAGLGL